MESPKFMAQNTNRNRQETFGPGQMKTPPNIQPGTSMEDFNVIANNNDAAAYDRGATFTST